MSDEEISAASPAEISLDAALQLEEMRQGKRKDAPEFNRLVTFIKEPKTTYSGKSTVSMLTDVRSVPLVRKAIPPESLGEILTRPEFKDAVSKYLDDLIVAVEHEDLDHIKEAKQFCLAFNHELLSKNFDELVSRQHRQKRPRFANVH